MKVEPVPTLKAVQTSDLLGNLERRVVNRIRSAAGEIGFRKPPLPVLAVLESKSRVDALKLIVEELASRCGDKFNVVIIDDEADQASQNARARRQQASAIFAVLRDIRRSAVRNCLLSYTATPQAVLLTEEQGPLRPRLCSVISNGVQYFGLEDLMSDAGTSSRRIVPDSDQQSDETPPESLRIAILDFLVKGLVFQNRPEAFYGCDSRFVNIATPANSSVQMLIHPSSRTRKHNVYYRWVKSIVDEFSERMGEGTRFPDQEFVDEILLPRYKDLLKRAAVKPSKLPDTPPDEWIQSLSVALADAKLLIVNADLERATGEEKMPSKNRDWDANAFWFLIGGDILGRGVTIPTLASTYFVRTSKSPQFDTLSQQMRFCGYRSRYAGFIDVWAPDETFEVFGEMLDANDVLYAYAGLWDRETQDLMQLPHQAAFIGEIQPTRSGVFDPQLVRLQSDGIIFQSRSFFSPNRGVKNAGLLIDLGILDASRENPVTVGRSKIQWNLIRDFSTEAFLRIVAMWSVHGSDIHQKRKVAPLFDGILGRHGLSDAPLSVAIREPNFVRAMARQESLTSSGQFRRVPLKLGDVDATALRGEWDNSYQDQSPKLEAGWFDGRETVTVFGDQHRNLRTLIPRSGVLITFEPFDLSVGSTDAVVGFGIAMTVSAPEGFKVWFWGKGN